MTPLPPDVTMADLIPDLEFTALMYRQRGDVDEADRLAEAIVEVREYPTLTWPEFVGVYWNEWGRVYSVTQALGLAFIHPKAKVDPTAIIAAGAQVGPGAVIGPDVVIESDVRIGKNAVIGPEVVIEAGAYVGVAVVIEDGVTIKADVIIGRHAHIGCDAVVGDDVKSGVRIPARTR